MDHSCGKKYSKNINNKYIKHIQLSNKFKQFFEEKYKQNPYGYQTETILCSSYIGPVNVPVWESPIEDEVYLQMTTEDGVLVKVLDIKDVMSNFGTTGLPDVEYLKKITPTRIKIKENKEIYDKIQKFHEYKTIDTFE